jgi:hypothetical protein
MRTNVITAHSHHCSIGPGLDGSSVAIEAGGLHDKSKTAYLQRSTTFPHWSQGYVFVDEDNIPHVRSPLWTA